MTGYGTWRMLHPQTGAAHMIIEIADKNGELEGRIAELADGPADAVCWNCVGERKNQPLAGMVILWDVTPVSGGWNAVILRPATGMINSARIELENGGKALKIISGRGPLRVAQT